MKKKCDKALRRAYRKGRKDGFDHGLSVAQMIYNEIVVSLKRELEKMNSDFILGEQEENDGDT